MAGPWEDFKSPATAEGPWADFAAPAQAPASTAAPWEEFAPKAGLVDYGTQTLGAVTRGAVGAAVTSPLQGLAGQIYEPDTSKPIPAPPPGGYTSAEQVPELPTLPVAQSTPYKLAQSIEGVLPQDSGILNPVVRDLAQGFGSVGGNIATMFVPGVRALAPLSIPAQGAGEATERAVKAGATEDQIRRAASLGNIAGATEFADALLPTLGTWGKVASLTAKVGINTLKGVFIEGGQEGLQQFIQNLIAKGVYKPEQTLSEDVAYNAVIGGIVGGTVSGAMTRRTPDLTPPGQDLINQSVAPTGPTAAPSPVDPNLVTEIEKLAAGLPTPPPVAAPVAPAPVPTPTPAPDDQAAVIKAEIEHLTNVQAQATEELKRAVESGDPVEIEKARGPRDYVKYRIRELQGMLPTPTVEEAAAHTVPKERVAEIEKQVEKFRSQPKPIDELLAPIPPGRTIQNVSLRDEMVETNAGIDPTQVSNVLSQQLYGEMESTVSVSVKELFQNAFDAIKGRLERKQGEDLGNIDIKMDPVTRTVRVYDDGLGMPASVMGNEFLTIGGTVKETNRPSGGFGVAKVQILLASEKLRVRSLRDGKYAELNTSGPELQAAINKVGKSPPLRVRAATAEDRALFPKGHGTIVEVVLPQQYVDPGTEEVKQIPFETDHYYHRVLRNSPLFSDIGVTFNGEKLSLGSEFPLENYTQFANVKFGWGTARIYITQTPRSSYGPNAHVLSNGLWQFSLNVKRDPNSYASENIPFQIYVDLNPRVAPGQIGYPFAANRQEFSPATKKGFGELFNYISLLYQRVGLEERSRNFGTMQYLEYDSNLKRVKANTTFTLEPKSPPPPNAFTLPSKIETVRVEEGKLVVNGREVPELTPQMLEGFKVTTNDLSIDQKEIDADRVTLHDNTNIVVSSSETRSVVDYGREKFGQRFDEFVFAVGDMFKTLRNVVARDMTANPNAPKPKKGKRTPSMFEQVPFEQESGYENLTEGAVGVSLDSKYHGVSITLPFTGIFVNPFLVTYGNDPAQAALSTVTTMIHEIAHHKPEYRKGHGHDVGWRHEMANIQIMLNTNNEFNFHEFQQRMVDIYASYQDVFNHMNGVWTSGDFTLQPRGKRFEDFSADETGDGNVFGNAARSSGGPPRGSSMADWALASATTPPSQPGRGGPANTTRASRSHRPSDNGRAANYSATKGIDPGITAPPQQPEVNVIRETVRGALGELPPEIREAASHADRYNWMYKYLAGITQLLDGNPYFQPLRKYVERVRQMHSDESKIHDAALRLSKEWRDLDAPQMKALENLIFDVQNMPYLSPAERSGNQWRNPTAAELEALVRKHKIGTDALKVYNRIRQMDETFLRLLEQEAIAAARRRIADPVRLAARIDEIAAQGQQARSQPFFPFTRFGRYYLIVKDQAGKVTHFETFEPARFVGITLRRTEKYQQAKKRELERRVPAGHTVETGVLPETAEPLVGLPTLLLQEMLDEGVQFTSAQVEAIKLMQNRRNPAMSLKRRTVFSDTSITGVSRDLPRSFAKYYFHGGRYYAKTRHLWALKGHIVEAQVSTGNKAGLISSHMNDHLTHTVLDARGDFGAWKGFIFLYAMGYSVAAATQNLTQTPMVTYPFLAGKFGDIRASRHLIKSMTDVTNYYRRGKYVEPSPTTSLDFEMKSLGYGIKTGRISETQAPELAGLAGGGKLISGMGGTPLEQAASKFQEKAALMFELAEQFNRRVAWRAALRLAMENPKAKFVDESVQKYQAEFEQLKRGDQHQPPFTEAEARAIVTAVHAVDQTQFVYARYARSRLFRGPRNILFVFQQYIQSLLWMLGGNKADVLPRWLIITLLMGGLGGVPGYEDMRDIFRALSRWFFGKDVNTDKLIREYALQWFNGKIDPGIVLHGLSRKGFGLPALVDSMGSLYTGTPGRTLTGSGFEHSANIPLPVLDRSRAIGASKILPFSVGKMFIPIDKTEKVIADEAQRASGAFFSVGFNLYKALMDRDNPAGDFKRWEKAMPRALSSGSRAYRAFTEGRERGGKGGPNSAATIVNYDVRDTEQMMEVLALGLGYQPLRQQAKWDAIMMQAETTAFYDLTRKGLLEEYYEALKGRNPKEIEDVKRAIIKFNTELPTYARPKVITPDTIQRSMGGRERSVISRETGVPVQKSNIGIAREMQRLFPEAAIDVRRVR